MGERLLLGERLLDLLLGGDRLAGLGPLVDVARTAFAGFLAASLSLGGGGLRGTGTGFPTAGFVVIFGLGCFSALAGVSLSSLSSFASCLSSSALFASLFICA